MTIQTLAAVALGGAVGASLRYLIHSGLTAWHGAASAWSTMGINIAGSFLLGMTAVWMMGRETVWAPLLMIGVLGGFTTFSTFSLDTIAMFRDRGAALAALYVGGSVTLSLLGFVGGQSVARGVS